MITAAELRRRLSYDPQTGLFTWLPRDDGPPWWNGKFAGRVAGSTDAHGYHLISINHEFYRAHNLAFLYVDGEFPKGRLDHIDGCRSNNRWTNLRIATHSQNCANRKLHVTNLCGLKGVRAKGGKFEARITKDGKTKRLGMFISADAAHRAYVSAAKDMFGDFSRPS